MQTYTLSDNSYLPERDRQTLSEDVSYKPEILARHPTIFFRPGDRTSPQRPLYTHADAQGLSNLGLIVKYGSHALRVPPVHEEPRMRIRVISLEAKKVRDITADEYSHGYQEIHDAASLISWLQKKYPEDKDAFTLDFIVTLHHIAYV